jgi:hypothetical protein
MIDESPLGGYALGGKAQAKKHKKNVKRSVKKTANVKKFTDRQCQEILELADVLKMKLAELKKRV